LVILFGEWGYKDCGPLVVLKKAVMLELCLFIIYLLADQLWFILSSVKLWCTYII